jgi:hypothetical protein
MYAPGPPPGPPQKSNTLKYLLFGCLGIILIGGLITVAITMFVVKKAKDVGFDSGLMEKNPAVAIAKMAAAANPDVDVVSTDEDKQTITLREKSTGKTVTLNFEDIKKGNFSFSDDKGETRISAGNTWRPPSWVPVYPGAKTESGANTESPEQDAGGGGLSTSDAVDKVVAFYEAELKKQGLEVNKHSISSGADAIVTVVAQDEARGHNVNVVVTPDGGGAKIQLSFSRKK